MKILYILDQDIHSGKTSGIIHKIKAKVDEWNKLGFEVELLSLYSFTLYNREMNVIDSKNSFKVLKHTKIMTLYRLMKSSYLLYKHINKFNFDLIYFRTPRLYMPFISSALKHKKVVMELNSDDVEEWRCNNKFIWIVNNITRHLFYSKASAFVSVSKELDYRYKNFSKRTIVIGNGISTDEFSMIKDTENKRPQICFVGSPGYKWHGIEKIEWLAKNCIDYDFHLIGEFGEDLSNMKYYGYLTKEEVNQVISKCDIAISTLSLYAKNMNEASPLKSRQYMALGLPFIYAYYDTDLDGSEEFTLRIDNNPSNIEDSLEDIRDFVTKSFRNINLRTQARVFAENHIDVKVKEKVRLKFLSEI